MVETKKEEWAKLETKIQLVDVQIVSAVLDITQLKKDANSDQRLCYVCIQGCNTNSRFQD